MNKRQSALIIGAVLLCAGVMSCADGLWHLSYAPKSALKAALFLGVPLALWYLPRRGGALRALFRPGGSLKRAAALGAAVFAVILAAYALLRGRIDFSGIAAQLTGQAGVNAGNFLFVALYISFVNSLLEEFFFRGFAFLALREAAPPRFALAFSALAFAAYHLGMTAGWFHPAIWLLAMLGLFAGGVLFSLLDAKEGALWPSWLVHLAANLAINLIGLLMFRAA